MMWIKTIGVTLSLGLFATSTVIGADPAYAAGSQLVADSAPSSAVGGAVDFTVYLPAGYDANAATTYPSLYLLHGRGDTQAAWQQEAGALDELIASGAIPPMIVVMPDAPWSNGGSYYVDSEYTGTGSGTTPGVKVETAFTTDLVGYIDANYRTLADRAARAVGGYSMGGAGALRYATVHQDLFSAGLVLSPAVYAPSTPVDSSTREFGAYGVGSALYDEARYQALNYPASFAALNPALPVHLFIGVGDDEYANPKPEDAIHDLDYEAATLYNQAKRVPGVSAELRVYDGGHEWGVWDAGFREGIVDLAGYLQSEPAAPFTGAQFGSVGDDRAGGVLGLADGSVIHAVNAADSLLGQNALGGFDVVVQKLDSTGKQVWVTPIATALNERSYGVVDGGNGSAIIAGFMRQNHNGGSNDDALTVKLDADGTELWRTTFGSESAADRVYGVASDTKGGAFLTGYTSGTLPGGTSAGDKDAIVAHVDAAGTVLFATQFGSTGEDKGFAVAASADGGVYVGGVGGGAMPGTTAAGGSDGWIAKFTADGTREWLTPVGTAASDQVSALVATASGVVATGFTRGTLGAAAAGENDAFIIALGADGSTQWTTQTGSAGDDRGAAIATDAAGRILVGGHTNGRISAGAGGVDVFTLTIDPAGTVIDRSQFGSVERDGADEYDEANLYLSGGNGSTWIQGLTAGQVAGAKNSGAGDVFLTSVDFAAVSIGVPAVVPPVVTPGVDPDGSGTGGLPGSGSEPRSPALFGSALTLTGVDAARLAALAALLLMAGAGVAAVRRSGRGTAH
ncbi:alpha/beta hydrolase-fold protein [Leifsonia sp. YAF41]|uniref:alpha/beta hydrolase-fold protein n=1 Tax=Leifsonia sp. YAF41 TaxID=3233086 RepID=UPI003F9C71DA